MTLLSLEVYAFQFLLQNKEQVQYNSESLLYGKNLLSEINWVYVRQNWLYSDISANEDNSFRNHVR
jgi:hypothetical protein